MDKFDGIKSFLRQAVWYGIWTHTLYAEIFFTKLDKCSSSLWVFPYFFIIFNYSVFAQHLLK